MIGASSDLAYQWAYKTDINAKALINYLSQLSRFSKRKFSVWTEQRQQIKPSGEIAPKKNVDLLPCNLVSCPYHELVTFVILT